VAAAVAAAGAAGAAGDGVDLVVIGVFTGIVVLLPGLAVVDIRSRPSRRAGRYRPGRLDGSGGGGSGGD
jgi:hypothetical protein